MLHTFADLLCNLKSVHMAIYNSVHFNVMATRNNTPSKYRSVKQEQGQQAITMLSQTTGWGGGLWKFNCDFQGFVSQKNYGRGALTCSPKRFKESCQETDSYEHHWIVTIFRWAKHCFSKRRLRRAEERDCSPTSLKTKVWILKDCLFIRC